MELWVHEILKKRKAIEDMKKEIRDDIDWLKSQKDATSINWMAVECKTHLLQQMADIHDDIIRVIFKQHKKKNKLVSKVFKK